MWEEFSWKGCTNIFGVGVFALQMFVILALEYLEYPNYNISIQAGRVRQLKITILEPPLCFQSPVEKSCNRVDNAFAEIGA